MREVLFYICCAVEFFLPSSPAEHSHVHAGIRLVGMQLRTGKAWPDLLGSWVLLTSRENTNQNASQISTPTVPE